MKGLDNRKISRLSVVIRNHLAELAAAFFIETLRLDYGIVNLDREREVTSHNQSLSIEHKPLADQLNTYPMDRGS